MVAAPLACRSWSAHRPAPARAITVDGTPVGGGVAIRAAHQPSPALSSSGACLAPPTSVPTRRIAQYRAVPRRSTLCHADGPGIPRPSAPTAPQLLLSFSASRTFFASATAFFRSSRAVLAEPLIAFTASDRALPSGPGFSASSAWPLPSTAASAAFS